MTFPDLAAMKDFAGWKAARAPRTAGPAPDTEHLRAAYLGLLKLALCDLAGSTTTSVSEMLDGSVASRELRGEDRRLRSAGLDWPLHGLTMVGLNRLDDLQECVETVVADGVAGDVIEAGSWRGGASILMRATLDSLGATNRSVYVADSFEGFPAAVGIEPAVAAFFAVTADEVLESFGRFGLEQGVEIIPGFFADTLDALVRHRWAVVRLDADQYGATRTALEALYPQLSVGGYLIVDDYGAMVDHECRRAIDEFRAAHGITEPLEQVDWTCVRWRRESDAAIEVPPPPQHAPTQAAPPAPAGAPHVPTGRERELEHEVAALRKQLRGRSWRRRR